MFPARREVLRAKSGTLTETPLPLLLHALLVEERSATLELQLRNLIKRVHFEAGVPVGCESNLLHETFGKTLVTKNKLTEAQHHALLAESASTGKPLQTLVVEKQLVSGFELFKLLQNNLAHTLLDAFRWGDAKWKLGDLDDVPTPIKMNTAQLVYLGAMQLPIATLDAHFALDDSKLLALAVDVNEELKLPAKDLRLVQTLKKRASLAELLKLPGVKRSEIGRKLYALCVLEFVDYAEVLDAKPKAPFRSSSSSSALTQLPVAEPVEPPAKPPKPVDDEKLMNALSAEFLSYRTKDAFDLLGVTPETPVAALAAAFLAKCGPLSPALFHHPDAKNRAELLLLAYARAYGQLVEPDQHALHRKRRENLAASRKKEDHSKAAEHFKIRTELLDAQSQFVEGKKRLEDGQLKSAIEHFQYAADIEPTGKTLAYLALARFRQAPEFAAEASLQELAEACTRDPQCEEAWAFRADLALSLSRKEEAADAYRHAAQLNPKQGRYQTALKGLTKR
ncbi:MAG: molecular chaperone DnaJ [Archangium sp.]